MTALRYSPAHCDFQVYDTEQYGIEVNPVPGLIRFGVDMVLHDYAESGEPTSGQMDMGTEMRYRETRITLGINRPRASLQTYTEGR